MKNNEVVTQAFAKAELAAVNPVELNKYENSLKTYRDPKAVPEGKLEGRLETANVLNTSGGALGIITQATGLTEQQIDAL